MNRFSRNRQPSDSAHSRISFLIPPASERIGGIDTALDGLSRHLTPQNGVALEISEDQLDGECDLAHFHGMWQTQHSGAYRRCLANEIPYVVSPHGMLEPWAWRHKRWKKWPYYQLIARRQLRNAAAVFAASELEAKNLTRFVEPSRIQVLPFGIDEADLPERRDARMRLGFQEDEQVLLYFSRVDQKKGLDLLLEALRGNTQQRWRVVIAGNGNTAFTQELQRFAATHEANLPRITWAGGVWGTERWDYLVGADLFCLPTRSENFGFAVLEALWAGTPVITTTATPWAKHIEVDGLQICNPDIPSLRDELTVAMSDSAIDCNRRDTLRDWCRSNYHWQTIATRYAKTYQALANTSSTLCLPS